jgi:adenylate kinase family enzyme
VVPLVEAPTWDPTWRRVAILGAYGAGKTTLARQLGSAAGLPVTHLDSLLFDSEGTKVGPSEWTERHRQTIAQDAWVLDGNILDAGGIDERLDRADVAIVLIPPRWRSTWQFVKRAARVDVPSGRPDAFTLTEIRAAWRWPRDRLPLLDAVLRRHPSLRRLAVRSRADVASLVRSATTQGPHVPPPI